MDRKENELREDLEKLLPPARLIRDGMGQRLPDRSPARRRRRARVGALGGVAAALAVLVGFLVLRGQTADGDRDFLDAVIAREIESVFAESGSAEEDAVLNYANALLGSERLSLVALHREVAQRILTDPVAEPGP